jgi:hypothetical protein
MRLLPDKNLRKKMNFFPVIFKVFFLNNLLIVFSKNIQHERIAFNEPIESKLNQYPNYIDGNNY